MKIWKFLQILGKLKTIIGSKIKIFFPKLVLGGRVDSINIKTILIGKAYFINFKDMALR